MNRKILPETIPVCVFFLIHLANRSFRPEWIELADKRMVANANIFLQVLKSARERLKEAGLLSFVPGGGFRVKTKYQILTPKSGRKLSPYYLKTKDKNLYGTNEKIRSLYCFGERECERTPFKRTG
jgi:hypothetical protein